MEPSRQLVRVKHGSHLYGTNTPQSDQDFKGVHLPSGMGIILQRPEEVIRSGFVSKLGTKNTSEAIDSDSYSLQKFLTMLGKGDTVATEILFAPPEFQVETSSEWEGIQLYSKRHLLNRQAKGFVGYCVRQAAKYGIKGSRMAAVKKLLDLLEKLETPYPVGTKLAVVEPVLRVFTEHTQHSSFKNIPSPNGTDMWHIECCDRMMPRSASIVEAIKVYQKVWLNYGERARAAMTNEGIDWKAMSHAVRVAGQAIELLTTHTITFPRPNADHLKEIKLGQLPYSEIGEELEKLVVDVHRASATSMLPEETYQDMIDGLVFPYYLDQTEN